jgi:flagellar biosynthesis protein FlhF
MKLRRFVGATTAAALARVKEALGSEAMILETRSVRGGFEVTAAVDPDPAPAAASGNGALTMEVRELARLVRALVGGVRGPDAAALVPELGGLYASLLAHGMNGTIAASVLEETAARIGDGTGLGGAVAAAVESGLAFAAIGDGERPVGRRARGPRIRVFCGPPGDGKTTTIAKLAGRAMVHGGRRVALVSTDTYRVGGNDELAAYARILDVPLATATSATELRAAVERFHDVDDVLVDTAGVTTCDVDGRRRLEAFTRAAGDVRSTLVISATTSAAVTRRVWETLRELRPDACIVTKVDEAPAVAALETLWGKEVPLAFFGTGRRIPHDIEAASPARVAAWLTAA